MKMFSPTNLSIILVPRLSFHHTFAYPRNNISANILHLLLSLHLARSWFSRHGKRSCAKCLLAKLWAHARLFLCSGMENMKVVNDLDVDDVTSLLLWFTFVAVILFSLLLFCCWWLILLLSTYNFRLIRLPLFLLVVF